MPRHRASAPPTATATTPSSSPSAPRKEKHLTKPELGHLKKADAAAAQAPRASSATRPASCSVGDTVTVDVVRAEGDTVKVAGVSKGKGFQGTIKRHNFASGPKSPRLAQRARPGLDRRLGLRPRACSRASAAPARWATSASPSAASRSSSVDAEPEPAARPRRRPRRRAAASWRCVPMARRPRSSAAPRRSTLDDDAFGARFNGPLVHETVRAELNARRQGTASTKTRGQVRGGGAKPWRQKGTGRARAGSIALADLDRRRHRLRPAAAPLHLQGQPQGAPRRAAQRAVACTPSAARSRCSTPRAFDDALDQAGRRAAGGLVRPAADARRAARARTQARVARSFRNLAARLGAARRPRPASPTSSAPPGCSSPRTR